MSGTRETEWEDMEAWALSWEERMDQDMAENEVDEEGARAECTTDDLLRQFADEDNAARQAIGGETVQPYEQEEEVMYFIVETMPADGHCLYHCFAQSAIGHTDWEAQKWMRKELANALEMDVDLQQHCVLDDELAGMRGTEYGGELQLKIFAKVHKRNVVKFTTEEEYRVCSSDPCFAQGERRKKYPCEGEPDGETVYVAYRDRGGVDMGTAHYDLLKKVSFEDYEGHRLEGEVIDEDSVSDWVEEEENEREGGDGVESCTCGTTKRGIPRVRHTDSKCPHFIGNTQENKQVEEKASKEESNGCTCGPTQLRGARKNHTDPGCPHRPRDTKQRSNVSQALEDSTAGTFDSEAANTCTCIGRLPRQPHTDETCPHRIARECGCTGKRH